MKRKVDDYDFIATGDLGKLGSEILIDLMEHENIILKQNYADCGCMIYDKSERVFMGGSGAGCYALFGGIFGRTHQPQLVGPQPLSD